jgi:hypothetical protein
MPSITFPVSPAGAILEVTVQVSGERRLALKAAGKQIPKPVFAQAEIDTGASCTVIDPSIAKALELQPKGRVSIQTASTGSGIHHGMVASFGTVPRPT